MFLKMTEHYKGRFPVDVGGLVFGGFGQKEVEDSLGKMIADANFPLCAPCDREGNYTVAVPPVKVLVFVDEPPAPKVEDVPAVEDTDEASVLTDEQPQVEAVTETKVKAKGKAKNGK